MDFVREAGWLEGDIVNVSLQRLRDPNALFQQLLLRANKTSGAFRVPSPVLTLGTWALQEHLQFTKD